MRIIDDFYVRNGFRLSDAYSHYHLSRASIPWILAGLVFLIISAARTMGGESRPLERIIRDLSAAQRNKNVVAVEKFSLEATRVLGSKAGVPEIPTKYAKVPNDIKKLTRDEIRQAFTPTLEQLVREAWWTKRPKPEDMPQPPRMVASVVEGCLAARRAGCEQPDRLLDVARQATEFLVWAQEQGGQGCFPFPAMRGKTGRSGELAERAFAKAKAEGRVDEVIKNGWFITDDGNGDLQYDNGLAGVAVLRFYEATQDAKYLRSACAAADWALRQPAVRNWNYNSFSVFLLSEVYRVTKEPRYLEAAKEKARLGIYPGQLLEGPNRGHWNDPHNASFVYHYILLRGLASLVTVLPEADADYPRAKEALLLGLHVRNHEVIKNGIAHPETVLETLSRIRLEACFTNLPADSGVVAAYEACLRYATAHYRNRGSPMPPVAWGFSLEVLSKTP